MKYSLYMLITVALLTGCSDDSSKGTTLNGWALAKDKCAKCHNLDMPPKSYEDEIAPSMMAVVFHLKDFIKVNNPSDHQGKVVSFIKDYVIYPSRDKSFCDKASLDSYGVMPSQKGEVTEDEIEAIANYIYNRYDNQELLKIMAEKQRVANMPTDERIFEKYRCKNCHHIDVDGVAPSFKMIASRYNKKDRERLMKSIKDGSREVWNKKIPMPPFKQMSKREIEDITDWILSLH